MPSLYAANTKRGYTGHEHLEGAGLIHMNGRVYDPDIGRFLSPDPFIPQPTFSQSYNRYSYVLNNPLSYTDPSGYQEEIEEIAIRGTRTKSYDVWIAAPFLFSSATNTLSNTSSWFALPPSLLVPVQVSYTPTGSHIRRTRTEYVKLEWKNPFAPRASHRESGDSRRVTLSAAEYVQARKWLDKSYKAIVDMWNSGKAPWPANGRYTLQGLGLSPAPGPDGALGLNKLHSVNPIIGPDMLEGTIVIYSGGALNFQELFLTLAHELAHFDDSWSHAQQEWYARELWNVYNGGNYGEMPDRSWCTREDYMTCFE